MVGFSSVAVVEDQSWGMRAASWWFAWVVLAAIGLPGVVVRGDKFAGLRCGATRIPLQGKHELGGVLRLRGAGTDVSLGSEGTCVLGARHSRRDGHADETISKRPVHKDRKRASRRGRGGDGAVGLKALRGGSQASAPSDAPWAPEKIKSGSYGKQPTVRLR